MTSMNAGANELIHIDRQDGIAWATIDAPPMNLLGMPLLVAITGLVDALEHDQTTRVVVIRSAVPDFFIAHGDVASIAAVPHTATAEAASLNAIHLLFERLRRLPQITIAQIEGYARGGGSEFCLACDMRFAARGKAVFGQPEIALGILPGAGGTARLTRLVGRARASEIILGGDDFHADEAERYGWVNRALPPGDLGPFVEQLAHRIASFPSLALAEAKRAIRSIADVGVEAELLIEQRAFDRLMGDPRSERTQRMERFLSRGIQTPEGERTLARACETLGNA